MREYSAAGPATQGPMLAMHALPLRPSTPTTTGGAEPIPAASEEGKEEASGSVPPAAKRARPSSSSSSSPAAAGGRGGMPMLAWVGRTADVLGRFDVAKAKELGIPPGK